jgi:hypothetical protein
MKDPRKIMEILIATVIGVAFAGAILGIDVSKLLNAITELGISLFIGALLGVVAWKIASDLTGSLPKSLLAGGTTTTVVAAIIEIWLNTQV